MSEPTLTEQFKALRDGASAQAMELYDELVDRLAASGALSGALKEGDKFPDFQLPDAEGRLVSRASILAQGPAIIIFDRGNWCPYCTAALSTFAKLAPEVRSAGATLLAVTPEVAGGAAKTKAHCSIDFDVVCDLDSALALSCGLMFPVPDELRQGYLARGIDLEKLYGNDAWMLPAPATFVVDKNARIVRRAFDPDFRYRLEPSEIIGYLADLR